MFFNPLRFIGIILLSVLFILTQHPAKAEVSAPEGVSDLKTIYKYIQDFRKNNQGQYPQSTGKVVDFIRKQAVDQKELKTRLVELANIEVNGAPVKTLEIPYVVYGVRPDKSPVGTAHLSNLYDILASTSVYVRQSSEQTDGDTQRVTLSGYYLILTDKGTVKSIPFDESFYFVEDTERAYTVYPDQAGVAGERTLTYQEFWTQTDEHTPNQPSAADLLRITNPAPKGKRKWIEDNGGPESLITLSRLLALPTITEPYLYVGIEREKMWQVFDPAQPEFTLADIAQGAAKLGLPLQQKKLSLDELYKLGTPAIFLTQDSKRLVTLADLDDQQAIVLDQGMTRIVSREVLQGRYGGEALIAQAAADAPADAPRVLASDPIRIIEVKDKSADIKQEVKITNSGKSPLTLQIERPIPGGKDADLSSEMVLPGQSSTLSLTLRWRDILKGETQSVFVFLKTNDPRRPRLQLGFKLNAAPDADAKPAAAAKP